MTMPRPWPRIVSARGSVAAGLGTADGASRAVAHVITPSVSRRTSSSTTSVSATPHCRSRDLTDDGGRRPSRVNLMGAVRAFTPIRRWRHGARGGRQHRLRSGQAARAARSWTTGVPGWRALLYLTKALAGQTRRPFERERSPARGRSGRGCGRDPRRPGRSIRSRPTTASIATPPRPVPARSADALGIGQPEDVARAAVFLASPRARFISGAGLDIGGTIRGLI